MNEEYRTQDFVTAAYLACDGFDLELERVQPGRVEFVAPGSAELRRALTAYRRGEARVPPGAFHLCQVELRRRMDSALR